MSIRLYNLLCLYARSLSLEKNRDDLCVQDIYHNFDEKFFMSGRGVGMKSYKELLAIFKKCQENEDRFINQTGKESVIIKNMEYYECRDFIKPIEPKKPTRPQGDTPRLLRHYAGELERYEKAHAEYVIADEEYSKIAKERLEEFKTALFVDNEVQLHPKSELLFTILHERYKRFQDIADDFQIFSAIIR